MWVVRKLSHTHSLQSTNLPPFSLSLYLFLWVVKFFPSCSLAPGSHTKKTRKGRKWGAGVKRLWALENTDGWVTSSSTTFFLLNGSKWHRSWKKQADIKSRDQLTQLIWVATKMIQEDARQVSSSQTIVYDVRIMDAPVAVLSVSQWFYSYNLYIILLSFHLPSFFLSPKQHNQQITCFLPALYKMWIETHRKRQQPR